MVETASLIGGIIVKKTASIDIQSTHTVIHAASAYVAMHICGSGSTVVTENTAVNIYNIIIKRKKCSALRPGAAIFDHGISDINRIVRVHIKCSACRPLAASLCRTALKYCAIDIYLTAIIHIQRASLIIGSSLPNTAIFKPCTMNLYCACININRTAITLLAINRTRRAVFNCRPV